MADAASDHHSQGAEEHDFHDSDQHPHHMHGVESASAFSSFFDRESRRQRALLDRKYRAKREKYEEEKQRMQHRTGYDLSLKTIKTGNLKVRNQLRSWVKFYCELRHGMLIMYKEDKHDAWMDTILLSGGLVIERPSRKEGFTFKFSHPLKQSIHAPRGPRGEMWINLLRMPSDHAIFRVATAEECDEWIRAFKQAIYGPHPAYEELMQCSFHGAMDDDDDPPPDAALRGGSGNGVSPPAFASAARGGQGASPGAQFPMEHLSEKSTAMQRQLRSAGMQQAENEQRDMDDGDQLVPPPRSQAPKPEDTPPTPPVDVVETEWIASAPLISDGSNDAQQVLSDETRNGLWATAANMEVGDCISVPISLRQPQSELQRISDFFLHADFITDAAKHKNPRSRLVCVLRFALSALCHRPSGMALPLPAVAGEVFRCMLLLPPHSATPVTRAFFIAELVDPGTGSIAFELTNRQAGWRVSGLIAPTTCFLGNTITHEYVGTMEVKLDNLGEAYAVQLPKTVTRGLVTGKTSTALQGQLKIACSATDASCDVRVDTHVRGHVTGRIVLDEEDALAVRGSWAAGIEVVLGDTSELLLACTSAELQARRLAKFVVEASHLWTPNDGYVVDSQSLWSGVQQSLLKNNVSSAQGAFTRITRRSKAREEHTSRFFAPQSGRWLYTDGIDRPWDHGRDIYEYQHEGELKALTIDQVGLEVNHDLLSPPTLRRRHISVNTEADSHNTVDVAAYTRARPANAVVSPFSRTPTAAADPGDVTAGEPPVAYASLNRELQSLEQRVLTVERMLARERLTVFTCILLYLIVLLCKSWC